MVGDVVVAACTAAVVVRVVVVGVEIEVVERVTDEVVKAFERLLPQLSRSAPALDAAALGVVAQFPGNHLLVARVDGEIVGTLTLVTFPIPTGLRAWIEDVVVDEAGRRQWRRCTVDPSGDPAGSRRWRPHRRSDLSPVTRGGKSAVRAARFRDARLEGLPIR